MATFENHARQGDVNIIRRKAPAKSTLEQVKPEGDLVVLARGSAIGNAHAVKAADATLWEDKSDRSRWLKVTQETALLHPEHHQPENGQTIELTPGEYLIARQVESASEDLRVVED